jgi:hypothetical protein
MSRAKGDAVVVVQTERLLQGARRREAYEHPGAGRSRAPSSRRCGPVQRRARWLPFSRRISVRSVRYSEAGLKRWMANRQLPKP